jgi:hypothetical protein
LVTRVDYAPSLTWVLPPPPPVAVGRAAGLGHDEDGDALRAVHIELPPVSLKNLGLVDDRGIHRIG